MGNFSTAWKAFWSILKSNEKAEAWNTLTTPQALPPPSEAESSDAEEVPQAPVETKASRTDEAVHTLAILQRESRLIDFLLEDISQCDDDQIGAAVRKIHDDARDALDKYFGIQPVMNQQESEEVQLPEDFDTRQIRLSGKASTTPPFKGTLIHKGWRAAHVKLPVLSNAVDPTVIVPAEVEIN